MIAVIPKDKVLVRPQFDRLRGNPGVFHGFSSIVLSQNFSVNINLPVFNLHCLPRKPDDPLNIICIFFIFVWKYNNLIALRIPETIRQFIYDQIVAILESGLHGLTIHHSPDTDKCNDQPGEDQDDPDIENPVQHLPGR